MMKTSDVAGMPVLPLLSKQEWLHIVGHALVNAQAQGAQVSYQIRPGRVYIALEAVEIVAGKLTVMPDFVGSFDALPDGWEGLSG